MENKHYDQRKFDVKDTKEITRLSYSENEVFVTIKKDDNQYYVTTKEETKGEEMLRFSSPNYQRSVIEFKMIAKVFLDELENISQE